MSFKLALALVASLLAVLGNLPYLRDTIKGAIQPHPFTWFVWSIVSCINFFGIWQKGGGYGVLSVGAGEIFTILIFFFSLRYGFSNVRPIDYLFLAIALAGLVPWFLTRDPTISVIVAVGIDLVAFLPTFRKAWERPDSEDVILYEMNVVRHVLTMGSLGAYNLVTMLHSISMIITNSIMTVLILLGRRRAR